MVPIKWGQAARAFGRVLWALVCFRPLLVSEEVAEQRLTICRGCEHLRDGQCKVCSCYVGIKTLLASEACPKKKWKKIFVWSVLRGIFKRDAK